MKSKKVKKKYQANEALTHNAIKCIKKLFRTHLKFMVKRHRGAAGASDVPARKDRKIKKEKSSVCARKDSSFSENVDKKTPRENDKGHRQI